jgi:hypothetical protein
LSLTARTRNDVAAAVANGGAAINSAVSANAIDNDAIAART